MSKLLITAAMLLSWREATPQYAVGGNAKYYADGVMKKVAVNRGYIKDPSEYDAWLDSLGVDGAASLMRYGDLGRKFMIVWADGTITKHISIDCANRRHYARRVEQGDVVEVDWATAQMMGMKGPVPVIVIFYDD